MALTLNSRQAFELICGFLKDFAPFLITGAPGIGKTDIITAAAKHAGYDLLISHPAVSDPTDFKGLPWFAKGDNYASFKPFGEFHQALTATNPTLWFHDDIGQASVSVQAAEMQLFRAKRVNGHVLPNCITFAGATNRRTDRAGVSGILETVKSRFVTIIELEADIDSWSNWAYANRIPGTLIAFLRYRPELLSAFVPTADLSNSPSPRTWEHAARVERMGLSAPVENAAIAGAVGEAAATEYLAFRRMVGSLVNLDAILLNPDKAQIPSRPDQLYATAVGLAARANVQNFAQIATYINRISRGEFAVLCVRDAIRRDDKLMHTNTFVQLASGPIGSLISGKVN